MESLADAYLDQSAAVHLILDRKFVFERVYGDPSAILGRCSVDVIGRTLAEALDAERADGWQDRLSRAFSGELLRLRERHGAAAWNMSVFPIRVDSEIRYAGILARENTPWNNASRSFAIPY